MIVTFSDAAPGQLGLSEIIWTLDVHFLLIPAKLMFMSYRHSAFRSRHLATACLFSQTLHVFCVYSLWASINSIFPSIKRLSKWDLSFAFFGQPDKGGLWKTVWWVKRDFEISFETALYFLQNFRAEDETFGWNLPSWCHFRAPLRHQERHKPVT